MKLVARKSSMGWLIAEYAKRFGHEVPAYAPRSYPHLRTALETALTTNKPIPTFESHVIDEDVSDEIFSPQVGDSGTT